MARKQPIVAASWSPPASPTQTDRRDLWASESWQAEAWALWRRLGELRYPTGYKARAVSRLNWRVIVNGRELDTAAGDDLLDVATEPLGVEEAARLLALNLEVAGAVWWLGFEGLSTEAVKRLRLPIAPEVETLQWAAISVVDPKLTQLLDASALRLKQWTPDPTDTASADSSLLGALGPARELVTLENQSVAQSRSRLGQSGIAFMPSEVSFPEGDSFEDDLLTASSAAIADPTSPAAVVPIVVTMEGDRIEQFRWEIPDRPYDERLDRKIDATIRRIAIALDVPAEMLTGLGDVNHWGQWLLQEETYRAHVGPTADTVGGVFAWTLEQLDQGRVEVEPDPGELLAHPPQLADLSIGFQLGIVTADEWRAAASLEPLEGDPVPPPALELVEPPATTETPPVAAAAGDEELGFALARIDAELRDSLAGALDMARITARSRIGGAIRNRLQDAGEAAPYKGTPNGDLAAAVGGDWSLPWVADIVAGSLEPLGRWWERHLTAAADTVHSVAGVDVTGWVDERAASVAQVVSDATRWVIEGLPSTDLDAGAQTISRRAVARAGGTAIGSAAAAASVTA